MSRAAFLNKIIAEPNDDTNRLVYADWLEEHAEPSDLNLATREFIALSCRVGKVSNVMPQVAYRWLDDNWKRLVPGMLAVHVPFEEGQNVTIPGRPHVVAGENGGPIWERNGRNIWMRINLKGVRHGRPTKAYPTSASLSFWKGFCVSCDMFSDWGWNMVRKPLLTEQPLCDWPPNLAGSIVNKPPHLEVE